MKAQSKVAEAMMTCTRGSESNAPTWSSARELVFKAGGQVPGDKRSEQPLRGFVLPSSGSSSLRPAISSAFRSPRKAASTYTAAAKLQSSSLALGLPDSERDRFAQEMVGSLLRMRGSDDRSNYLRYTTDHQGLPTDLVQLVLSHLPYTLLLDAQRTQVIPSRLITSDVTNLCIHRDGLAAAAAVGKSRGRAGELLAVYDHVDLLRRRSLDADESDPRKYSPVIQPKPSMVAAPETDLAVVPSLEQFKRRLDAFTNGQLRHLNWDNLFLGTSSRRLLLFVISVRG
jgi:hypothetical protein